MPLFSIVTVTYKNLAGLKRTAESVLNQVHSDYEWLIIDGGSQDGTLQYLESIDNDFINIVSEPDGGIFDAMQKGLNRSRGKYVIFMNAGDMFAGSEVLAKVRDAIGTSEPDIVYGDAIEEGVGSHYLKPARAPAANRYVLFTHHQAIFYRTARARAVGYDQSYRWSADWVFTIRMMVGATLLQVPIPICVFERGGVSQGDRHRRAMNAELFRIYLSEHRHGWFKSCLFWLAKVGTNRARKVFPNLYDKVRYKKKHQ
ncbi:glycosyltransferase family 2 protein [Sphingomonas crusticola]|uniref:glycosyltransferase family 2 protein n=1 Tax=Sphingomonas crusticola TaxID=1697973 RepID=UPI0013C2F846|nr:glycosyltransferase family 2 protein [Sphingomonas crusticola]